MSKIAPNQKLGKVKGSQERAWNYGKYGSAIAVREHLLSGKPITRLEALVFFGVSNLTDVISDMRQQGWIMKSRTIPYAAAVQRVNDHAVLRPPKNLPIRQIVLTEYRLSK